MPETNHIAPCGCVFDFRPPTVALCEKHAGPMGWRTVYEDGIPVRMVWDRRPVTEHSTAEGKR